MTKKSRQVDDLLAAIQRKSPAVASTTATAAEAAVVTESPARRSRIGKPVQFWLHEEDRRILRELSAWLAAQGVRASDSLVIRTALRSAKTGADFLQAYREAASLDGRLKQVSNPSPTP
jgi:hypothetical protein